MNFSCAIRYTESAGGIVLRQYRNGAEILVVERTKNVEPKWSPILRQLPKGGINAGESIDQAALREVLEETGYTAHIVKKAGTAQWAYERHGHSWVETVHYFFMTLLSTTPTTHDEEFDRISWMSIDAAKRLLSYPEERSLLREVIENDKMEF